MYNHLPDQLTDSCDIVHDAGACLAVDQRDGGVAGAGGEGRLHPHCGDRGGFTPGHHLALQPANLAHLLHPPAVGPVYQQEDPRTLPRRRGLQHRLHRKSSRTLKNREMVLTYFAVRLHLRPVAELPSSPRAWRRPPRAGRPGPPAPRPGTPSRGCPSPAAWPAPPIQY